jgi:hypothetical protein
VKFVGLLHELPFHLTASPVLSTSMQKEEVGHETTDEPSDPPGGVSTIVGADQLDPFQRAAPSTPSVATQNVDDAHAIVTAEPVPGSIVWAADHPGGSGGPKVVF